MAETIERIDLPTAAKERYLRYALSVITSRALPDVRDGMKPVQRRILFCMETDLKLKATARPVKSARVVGQVMSLYHPHSDVALYEAMVRMAQPFQMRYPLVDGHGNFGAITGDNAAAFRYTEARLQPLASELMTTLSEQTVDTRENYDGTTTEPEVLPTPLPMLLLNGSTGIAVGMATNIPPHNLREVLKATTALIDDPDATLATLMRGFKGPDFPTGGELLCSKAKLREIYETGRGTVKLRGTYVVEELPLEKKQRLPRRNLVVNSIPYGTTTSQVLAKVRDLLEARKLPQVEHVSDQTTADDGVRLVLELEPGADPTPIMAALYQLTPLQVTYGINLTCLLPTPPTADGQPGVGRPAQCDLKQILREWLDFRFEVVTRSLQFRQDKLEDRIHILEGLEAVLKDLDKALKEIRASDDKADARERLGKRFGLDAVQADAVLEIQLYRLAKLEIHKVVKELKEKRAEVRKILKLLKSDKPRWALIKSELQDFSERYKDRRQTKLVQDDDEHQYDPTLLMKKEDAYVVVTREGRVKRRKTLSTLDQVRLRPEDELVALPQGSTLEPVVFLTNEGSAYTMTIHDVPATKGFGEPIQKFFNFKDGERVIQALSLDPRLWDDLGEAQLFVITESGQTLRVPVSSFAEPSTKTGRRFARLVKGDKVAAVEPIGLVGGGKGGKPPKRRKKRALGAAVVATRKGYAARIELEEVPALSGVGKGKPGLTLEAKDRVVGAAVGRKLALETSRGAVDELSAEKLEATAFGELGVEVKKRGGFARSIPTPVLWEFEEVVG